MHGQLLHNGQIHSVYERLLGPGQAGLLSGWGIFSTLRVTGGVLFASERHFARMRADAARFRIPMPFGTDELEEQLQRLIEANQAQNATLRVCIVRNHGGAFEGSAANSEVDVIAFTADLKDWGAGVNLTYVPHGRHGASPFAGAKLTSWAQNLTWYEEAHERGFDEVILLNEEGDVSECTSANIFIIEKDHVLTPPVATSGCLPGVTRALLLEEVRVPGLTIREAEISPSRLESARQVFITSTTRDLLPVLSIDGEAMEQDQDTLGTLQTAFTHWREQYMAARAPNRIPVPA